MKKLLLAFLLLTGINFCSHAQWVSIPDTNFGTWLNTNGYAACMIGNNSTGWQMDTTCPAVVNEILISCGYSNIRDLTGIQYFDSLGYLFCQVSQLNSLPDLPPSLTHLICWGNQLSNLPVLPPSLTYLECWQNQLTNLATLPGSLDTLRCDNNPLGSLPVLPVGLLYLNCSSNGLTSLPILPNSLVHLNCLNNGLTSLPALPNNLAILDCRLNSLGSLPVLPNSLAYLLCSNCQLTNLPILPNALTYLRCDNNPLGSLPSLPNNLATLFCSQNQLVSLPALPQSLDTLRCQNNQLASLPDFPDSLDYCNISNNPITCLPLLKRIITFDFSNTLVTCLPNYGNVTNSTPSLQSLPLCQPGNACYIDTNCIGNAPTLNVTASSDTVCENSSVIVSPSYSLDVTNLVWTSLSGTNLGAGLGSQTFTPTFLNSCIVATAVNSSGCFVRDTTCIVINYNPIFNAGTTDLFICSALDSTTLGGTPTASGGTPGYTYQWVPSSTLNRNWVPNPIAHPLSTTTYVGSVIDLKGCMAFDSVTVYVNSVNLQAEVTNVTCNGLNNGQLVIHPDPGSQLFLEYSIDSGITFQSPDTFSNLYPGLYTIIVTDFSCYDTLNVSINQPLPLQIDSITTTNVLCNGDSTGTVNIVLSGGISPYAFLFNPMVQSFPNLPSGNYTVTVSDANGCTVDTFFTITQPPLLTAQIISATGGILPDTLTAYANGGTPPYVTSWYDSLGSQLMSGDTPIYLLSSGIYQYTLGVTDANGCSAIDSVLITVGCNNQCVWPGDADFNGLADNNDLLPIGLTYGINGIARALNQQSISWYAHICQDWTDTLLSGTNYKHIDCNGNGTINADDTLAIIQNYSLTHAKTNDRIAGWRMTDPALYVDLSPDTTRAGDTMYANLTLGDISIPATNVYGLAFTINYDALVVDSSKTRVTFGNSWLGNATDKISIAKDLFVSGQLKCALTRIDHTTRSGFGQIGQAAFVITTDNINGKNLAYHQMDVWLSDIKMIDNLGNLISVNAGFDSSQVEFEPVDVGIINHPSSLIRIVPNPANDEIRISVSEDLLGEEIRILDVEGRILMKTTISTTNHKLQTTNLSPGIYFIRVVAGKGLLTKRLVIAR